MKIYHQLIQKNLFLNKLGNIFFPKKPKEKLLPIITISREMGSGGKLIAYLVAKKLGKKWQVYHKDIIDKIAKEAKIEKALVEEIDEKNFPFVDKLISDFFGKKYLSLSSYHKHLVKIICEISQRGYAIIIGRGADYLLPHALKVRIICEMEQRIVWQIKYENLNRSQAIKRIEKSDQDRINFIKNLYNHDPRKAHHYDLVIRTGPNLSLEDAASLIVMMAKRRFRL